MKTLVLGDIHGRICWKDIIDKENPDKVVFLGDYVSTHEKIPAEQQCYNLEDILNYKEDNTDKVILLRGNHDMQHLGYSWAACSGFDRLVENYMISIKERFLQLTQWVYIQDNIVFSHAGVSKEWMRNIGLDDVNKINELEPSEKFGFWPCKLSDYSGISATQPPTWIRPWTLIDCSFGDYTYMVGHTPLGNNVVHPYVGCLNDIAIKTYKEYIDFNENNEINPQILSKLESDNKIWCCDALPYEYVIIENGKILSVKFEHNI